MARCQGFILTFLVAFVTLATSKAAQPNIIIAMADDMGNADYEGSPNMPGDPAMRTPAIRALEERGVLLNQSYTLQTCTPTRSALLTGINPYKMGLQIGKIKGTYLRWLPEDKKLLPESLRELGYKTHAVGKWHLGFCNWNLTPRYRGFDTFYGFLSGAQDYFYHTGSSNDSYDFRDNGEVAWENRGKYSTELHTAQVQKIIKKHVRLNKQNNANDPFFIYMAYQNVHSPFQAKQWYVDKYCSHVTDQARRTHCAMAAAMDESIKNITDTLIEKGVLNDTIILYLSDNGGPVGGYGSYNWPLRGGKSSFYEGGMRPRTIFVYPKKMRPELVGGVWDSMVHVTDWYPTLYAAAGGNVSDLQEMDGIDHLRGLTRGFKGKRNEMIYNIDPTNERSAVRIGDFKLMTGHPGHSLRSLGWVGPPGMNFNDTIPESIPHKQLYNVVEDPEERNNLYESMKNSNKVAALEALLAAETQNVVPFPDLIPKEPLGDPRYYSGAWSPGWCQASRLTP